MAGNIGFLNVGYKNVGVGNIGERNYGILNILAVKTIGANNFKTHDKIAFGNLGFKYGKGKTLQTWDLIWNVYEKVVFTMHEPEAVQKTL